MQESQSPKPVLIYLAGPIDGVDDKEAKSWRESVRDLASEQIAFFSPAHAYINPTKVNFPAIDWANRTMISRSNGVLAYFLDGRITVGTVREIEFARSQSIPVAVAGDLGPSLMTYDLMISDSLEGALLDLIAKVAEIQNMPPVVFGMPGMHIHVVQKEEEEESGGGS